MNINWLKSKNIFSSKLLLISAIIALSVFMGLNSCSIKDREKVSQNNKETKKEMKKYIVKYFDGELKINSDWNKKEWKDIQAIELSNTMGNVPKYLPKTKVKMMYNKKYIYVIFKVEDKFIRSVNTEINSKVSDDCCVEFFFTPAMDVSFGYFNLEVNSGGTPLIRFQKKHNVGKVELTIDDIKKIKIAHSLPKIVEPEIVESTTWTVEYKIPITMLKKYFSITEPSSGVKWRANFYQCADKTSNPHYLSWNKVENEIPNFHLPEYFGEIEFE